MPSLHEAPRSTLGTDESTGVTTDGGATSQWFEAAWQASRCTSLMIKARQQHQMTCGCWHTNGCTTNKTNLPRGLPAGFQHAGIHSPCHIKSNVAFGSQTEWYSRCDGSRHLGPPHSGCLSAASHSCRQAAASKQRLHPAKASPPPLPIKTDQPPPQTHTCAAHHPSSYGWCALGSE